MGPLRIIILAILLYIGYRLLTSGSRKKKTHRDTGRQTEPEARVTDVLVEDPVCHKLVPRQQAVVLEKDGKTLYFCSEECCTEFTSKKGEEG
ncbi:MAG: TRASH domain protein [Desulfobacterales bacterium]|nr:MAG: TRASH domain protein [Desulfobacterales bacterium]